jgi:predicted nucleotide-binding protein
VPGRSRSQGPPPIQIREFATIEEIDTAIGKVRRRLDEVRQLESEHVRHDDPRVAQVESNIRYMIRDVFSENSPEYLEHGHYEIIGLPPISMGDDEASESYYQGYFTMGMIRTVAMLENLIRRLGERKADLRQAPPTRTETSYSTTDVFVVHGREEGAKETVARFLEHLGLRPVILHEKPNKGRTLIQKFEDYSTVGFAVVLLTPDDHGSLREGSEGVLQPRARQNVILELGYFLGKLTRARVAALHWKGVEIPSDYDGVVFIPFDEVGGWKLLLAKELREAGLAVNMNATV